jgi:hypothetical protein
VSHTPDTADVLDRAADLILQKGWTQEVHARDESGDSDFVTADSAVCFCALGAISAAYGSDPSDETGVDAQFHLRKVLPAYASIPDWNDDPVRTKDEVVAKLREAAALTRGATS